MEATAPGHDADRWDPRGAARFDVFNRVSIGRPGVLPVAVCLVNVSVNGAAIRHDVRLRN